MTDIHTDRQSHLWTSRAASSQLKTETIAVAAWESTTTALNKFETMTPVTVKS